MRLVGFALLPVAAATLHAQSLATRVTERDGPVQVIFPSRPDVCGDGQGTLSLGRQTYGTYNGWRSRCVPGPARVAATVMSGDVTRLRTYVGPVRPSDVRTIEVSAADAYAWLAQLLSTNSSSRLAQDAMLPLVIVQGADPSPLLLSVARDDNRPTSVRRAALTHLAMEVNRHLGIDDASAETDDDEMRKEAVFVLSQHSHSENTPALMEVARSAKHPAVRRDAIFWLGQTGDVRAVADLYAELLKEK